MKDARARKFDVIVVARFDRFPRSVSHLLRALDEFNHLGINFVSPSEHFDANGKDDFHGSERCCRAGTESHNERVHMGICRARKQRKAPGRPVVEIDPRQVGGSSCTWFSHGIRLREAERRAGNRRTGLQITFPKTFQECR
jgi:hypothetical protein